jgi:hypothetical protein
VNQWRREYRAKTQCHSKGTRKFSFSGLKVVDVDRLAVHNRSTNNPCAIRDGGQSNPSGDLSEVSDAASDFAVDAPHHSIVRVTQSRSSLGNLLEHWLQITRRARDHAQDIAGSRFPCE